MSAIDALKQNTEAIGWKAAVVPYAVRAAAIEQVSARYEHGELDERLYKQYLEPILTSAPPEAPSPRSIILVATPSFPVRMLFTIDGASFPVMTAPGYLRGSSPKPEDAVREILAPFGFSAGRIDGPQKAMATLSGLARYGRNNISYVPGFGTFHALATFVSDLPCEDMPSDQQETLDRCAGCGACLAACPTGAIGGDRFLLHAERCITFWNEQETDVAFPDWIKSEWHNALFGCLRCKRACPENAPYLDNVLEGPSFDEEETRLLLAGGSANDLPDELRLTLAAWRLDVLFDYLPRNLAALVNKEFRRRTQADDPSIRVAGQRAGSAWPSLALWS